MVARRLDDVAIPKFSYTYPNYDDDDFVVCVSGESDVAHRPVVVVGFIVAPWARSAIVAFRAI
eukprot:6057880-Pyramimonas_sp.AAC.1